VELINLWRVSAPNEGPDTWLRLEGGAYQLWRSCAEADGSWSADSREFYASDFGGWSGGCGLGDSQPTEAPWLTLAMTYQPTDGGWLLLDAAGQELAKLTIDGAPPPNPNLVDEYREPPVVTDQIRAWLVDPAPMPSGLSPVTAKDIIGRWGPEEGYSAEPFVNFNEDGTWEGSDGCNYLGGNWRITGSEGRMFASSPGSTDVGCENAPIEYWLISASRAGLDGQILALVDRAGQEVGRLKR